MKVKQLGLRVLSTAAVLSIVSAVAAPAFADAYGIATYGMYYVDRGSVTVEVKNGVHYVTQVDADGKYLYENHEDTDGSVTITTEDKTQSTGNTITVSSDKDSKGEKAAKITLDDVNIKSTDKAAMTITGNGNVQLELNGKNTLDSSDAEGHAGLEKNAKEGTGSLYIKDEDQDGGSLTAMGGDGGAGIGGSAKTSDGKKNNGVTTSTGPWGENIVINGGTIDATGGKGAAGIGSGVNATGEEYNFWTSEEFVTITGGDVTATGGEGGAGIGGAEGKDGLGLYFRDGTVNATGNGGGAGIGGGNGANGDMIELGQGGAGETDLKVTATGSEGAAGIGGGKGGKLGTFVSYTGTTTATGGEGGAGIGSGEGGKGSRLYLCGGKLLAYGGEGAKDLGNGKDHTSESVIYYTDPNNKYTVAIDSEEVGEWNIATKTLEVKYKKGDQVVSSVNYAGEWTVTREPTCTEDGAGTYTVSYYSVDGTEKTVTGEAVIPALGHDFGAWVPDGAGHKTRTCSRCQEQETAVDENYVAPAAEQTLYVTRLNGTQQGFTARRNGDVMEYTSPFDDGVLTGKLEAVQALADSGVKTIVFTTNGRTSRFDVADLLAQGNAGDQFYLRHEGSAEAVLLLITADHSDLLQ